MSELDRKLQQLDSEQKEYILQTLAGRLRDAGQADRLRSLFLNTDWMNARFEGSGNVYDGYLADLGVAMDDVALVKVEEEINAGLNINSINACLHYTLIQSSLNTVSANFPPAFIALAVREGVWGTSKALSTILNIADLEQRFDVYLALLSTNKLTPDKIDSVLKTMLEIIKALSEDKQPDAFEKLGHYLVGEALSSAIHIAMHFKEARYITPSLTGLAINTSGDQRKKILQFAYDNTPAIDNAMEQIKALTALLSFHAGEEQINKAKEIVRMAEEKTERSDLLKALVGVAKNMDDPFKKEVIKKAYHAIMQLDDKDLAYDLEHILPLLHEPLRTKAVNYAFKKLHRMDDKDQDYDAPRPIAIMALSPYLSSAQRSTALTFVRNMPATDAFSSSRASTLIALANNMKNDGDRQNVLLSAMKTSLSEKYLPDRADALIGLIPLLEGDDRREMIRKALDTVISLSDEPGNFGEPSPRQEGLSGLAPYLTTEYLHEALAVPRDIKDSKQLAGTLVSLAMYLTNEKKSLALQTAFALTWANRKDDMWLSELESLLPHLEGDILRKAFSKIMRTPKDGYPNPWVKAITQLSPRLSDDMRKTAIETGMGLKEPTDRAEILTILAALLNVKERTSVIRAVFKAILQIPEYAEHLRAYAIRDVGLYLSGAMAEKALKLLLPMKRDPWVEDAIVNLIPGLHHMRTQNLLAIVRKLPGRIQRVKGFIHVLPLLQNKNTKTVLDEAVAITLSMKPADLDSEKAVLLVLPYLQGKQRQDMLEQGIKRAKHFGNWEMGAAVFVALAPFFEKKERNEVLLEGMKRAIRIRSARLSGGLDNKVVRKQKEILVSLLSVMDTTTLKKTYKLVKAMKPGMEKAAIQAVLTRYLPSEKDLLKEVQLFIVEHLNSLKKGNRNDLLEFCAHPMLFAPPVLTEDIIVVLVKDLLEICRDWKWQ